MGRFYLQDIEFLELLLIVFLDILGLVFSRPWFEDLEIPWGVTCVVSMDITITWGVLAIFLTAIYTLLSLFGTFFVFHGVSVLVWGRKLVHGNDVGGLIPFAVSSKGCKVSSFGIKTLWYQHVLVCSWRFVFELVHNFRLIQLWIVMKQGYHMCHSWITITYQSHILSCSDLLRFYHFVIYVALLIGEAFVWAKIGHNMVHVKY